MEVLTIFTKELLDKGFDYEVTLSGEEVGVRLYDRLTGNTLSERTSDTLEKALAVTMVSALDKVADGYVGLSKL